MQLLCHFLLFYWCSQDRISKILLNSGQGNMVSSFDLNFLVRTNFVNWQRYRVSYYPKFLEWGQFPYWLIGTPSLILNLKNQRSRLYTYIHVSLVFFWEGLSKISSNFVGGYHFLREANSVKQLKYWIPLTGFQF